MLLKNLELFLLIVEKGGLSAAGRELGFNFRRIWGVVAGAHEAGPFCQ